MAEQMMQGKAIEMVVKQTIPVGYKQTEVGVIPEDWDISIIGDIANVKTGPFGSALHEKDYVHNGTPIITVEHLGEMGITDQNLPMVSDTDRIRLRAYQLDEGDIVFSRVGSIDRNALVTENESGWLFSGRLLRVKLKSGCNSPKYISYHFHSTPFKKRVIEVAVGQTMPSLNTKILNGLLVVLPKTTEEQTAIAAVLSDIDSLIVGLEQLIAKKQAIKTATMQQLLTGRTRLPQFALRPDGTPKGYKTSELGQIPEDWITPTLKGITSNIIDYRGRTPRKLGLEWGGGNILALSAGNVKKGFIDYEAECYFGSDELYKKWMTSGDASKGDIVFTMEAPLGNVALIPNEDKYILSQRTILLQLERSKFLPTFIIQVFLSDMFQSYISESATGSTAQGIKRATFEKMFVAVPSCLEEQTAIATILSDMDSELTALEQKLAKARDLKQGMMQQLLTGRIRLPLPQEA
ncbi:restriction endonuclease subunit S [Aeromonas hydrophila]|uniref:restriction endonuclease subunit S n=1 Tax=Aeromonas hydrophila TaxID=644 RepID=UPI003988BFCD